MSKQNQKEDFPEEHPSVLPSDATYAAIIGVLMDKLGHNAVRITAHALREWRLKEVKITMQKNGAAILSLGAESCARAAPLTKSSNA